MSRYCLDTSAYSQFRRADPRVVELIDQAEWIGMPAVTLGELWAGFLRGDRRHQNERELREFIANPVVEVLAVDSEVSRHYADIVTDLRKHGTPVPTNDIWIAATAARSGVIVLTYDEHFNSIGRAGKLVLEAE